MLRLLQGQLRLTPLSLYLGARLPLACLLGSLVYAPHLLADTGTYFNPAALDARGGVVADLSQFERGEQLPGMYRVDIYLNDSFIESQDVNFISEDHQLVPELNAAFWRGLGMKDGVFPDAATLPDDKIVTTPGQYVPNASATLDFNRMRLNLSIPQAALNFRARDYVSPALWDQGMPAAMLNYGMNASKSWMTDTKSEYSNLFLRLDGGLNLGPWRLRNNATYTQSSGSQPTIDQRGKEITVKQKSHEWQNLSTYLQRDIHFLRSQLTMGDTSTPGDLFDSVQFRGVQLASDDTMLPDSLRGFAPVVKGIARSNALVTVRQNGGVIYQTNVAAGAFEIRDLYPTASSGNLEVTVREDDGGESTFIQPFSAVPGMQRDGQWRYALTGGKYRSWTDNVKKPEFAQGSLQYGLTNSTTVSTGGIYSKDYQAGLAGVGQGLGTLGSVSVDVTHAQTKFDNGETKSGQSWRAQYTKDILQSGTSFVLAGYRYSTSGYYDFREANEMLPVKNGEDDTWYNWQRAHNKRTRMQAQVTQRMGDYGSLSLTAYQQDYWNSVGKEQTFMVGYGVSLKGINYSLNLSQTRYPESEPNRRLYFSVQVPLDRFLAGSRASYNVSADNKNRVRNEVGLSGSALEDRRLTWGVREGYTNKGEGVSGSLYGNYDGTDGRMNAGYSHNTNSQQVNGGLSGGVLVHPYGVTLSQPLGDTVALVRAPGADNVRIKNNRGVTTDWRGYAVVPNLSAYRKNSIGLNTETLGDDVELTDAVQTVIPTRGAVVLADYKANVGARVLANILFQGKPVPFGATVSLLEGSKTLSNSFVGDQGEVYLSGVPEKSQVNVSWGRGSNQQCRGDVTLKPAEQGSRFRTADITCR